MSNLEKEFKIILEFEKDNPGSLSYPKKAKYKRLSAEHKDLLKYKFKTNRIKSFSITKTAPDNAVYNFLQNKFNYTDEEIKLVIKYHNAAMGAENIIGHYLEEFINENLSDKDWVWCSGNVLDKIDFIVFSGDAAFSGTKEQYDQVEEFFDQILEASGLQGKRDRLFIVPGNPCPNNII